MYDERFETSWVSDPLTARVWLEDQMPAGFRAEGNWQWDWSQKFRRTHSEPASGGTARHAFYDNNGVAVQKGDFLYALAWVDPEHPPQRIVLELNIGDGWKYRAYWGQKGDDPEGPHHRKIGPLPRWVSGCGWSFRFVLSSSKASGSMERRSWSIAARCGGTQLDFPRGARFKTASLPSRGAAPLEAVSENVWIARVPVEKNEAYTIELKNARGYGNLPLEDYRIRLSRIRRRSFAWSSRTAM